MVGGESCYLGLCDHPGGPNATDILAIIVGVLVCLAIVVAISIPIAIPLTRRRIARAKAAAPSMSMAIQIGTEELHEVTIAYYQSVAVLVVSLDEQQLFDRSFATGLRLTRAIEWTLGTNERHLLRLEKSRQRFYPQLEPQRFVAYVDGTVVARAATQV